MRELEEKREAVDNGNKRSPSNVQLSTLKWRGETVGNRQWAMETNAQRPTFNSQRSSGDGETSNVEVKSGRNAVSRLSVGEKR